MGIIERFKRVHGGEQIEEFIAFGSRAIERFHDGFFADQYGNEPDPGARLFGAAAVERFALKPLLYFDVYAEWNVFLDDCELMRLVDEFVEASGAMGLEQLEAERTSLCGGRRKETLAGLRRRLAAHFDNADPIAFHQLWIKEVYPLAHTKIAPFVAPPEVLEYDSRVECRRLLDALDKFLAQSVSRGRGVRPSRRKTVNLLRKHFCHLTGLRKFSWTADSGLGGPGLQFVADLFELIGCPPPTEADFRGD
ncbi:MAG: hypothetical protein JSR99_08295 [Proteobacteria bacterium]|nr:hypothetical protein [Pseudomonadota bacterium]